MSRSLQRDNAVVLCVDRAMFLPALSVATDAAMGGDTYDVIVLVDTGGVPAGFPAWHAARGAPFQVVELDFGQWVPEALRPNARFPRAAALRLVLTKYFAGRYRRILFLDADLWVRWPLSGLFDLDLDGKPIAATSSFDLSPLTPDGEYLRKGMPPHPAQLGFPRGQNYLNAGFLLIDTDQWERQEIGEKAIGFIVANRSRCIYFDQDGINAAVGGQFAVLSPGWSRNTRHFPDRKGYYRFETFVHHYYGDDKPWNDDWDGEAVHAAHFRNFFAGLWPGAVEETGMWRPAERRKPTPAPSLAVRLARRALPVPLRHPINRFLRRIPVNELQRSTRETDELVAAYLGDTPFVDVVQGIVPAPVVTRRRRATS